jgi:hypothetical protein
MMTLNSQILTLAKNLAHDRTFYDSGDICMNEDEMYKEGTDEYTEEIQERFDSYFDFYESEINKVFNPVDLNPHPNF